MTADASLARLARGAGRPVDKRRRAKAHRLPIDPGTLKTLREAASTGTREPSKQPTRKHTTSFDKRVSRRQAPELTPEQMEMLPYIAAGATNIEIATLERYAYETIRARVKIVLDRLGARNRAHAVVIAIRLGMLDPHDRRREHAIIRAINALYEDGVL